MSTTARVAVDEAAPPAWIAAHVSPAQLKLDRGLLWIVLVYRCQGLGPSRYSVAQRLYIHTIGKERKRANPSIRSLMADLEISENTVIDAVKDIEARGLLIVQRHGNGSNLYILAWPLQDTTSLAGAGRALCGQPTAKGGACTRPAGWGTTHQGEGPCKKHGGQPRTPDATPQPLRYEAGAHTSMVEVPYLNHCGIAPQPLRLHTSTIEDEYVKSSIESTKKSTKQSLVLAVGERTDRNARARETAPTAQPVNHTLTARAIINAIPRYRDAPPWARKNHLIPMTQAALNAGFGRDAIVRYAQMVTAEHRYAERQHIPEYRAALARLGRDHLNGDACPTHGQPECPTCHPTHDRPWTPEDQTDWERTLDYLGLTPDNLPTTTPETQP